MAMVHNSANLRHVLKKQLSILLCLRMCWLTVTGFQTSFCIKAYPRLLGLISKWANPRHSAGLTIGRLLEWNKGLLHFLNKSAVKEWCTRKLLTRTRDKLVVKLRKLSLFPVHPFGLVRNIVPSLNLPFLHLECWLRQLSKLCRISSKFQYFWNRGLSSRNTWVSVMRRFRWYYCSRKW